MSRDDVLALITAGTAARVSRRLLIYLHVPFCASKCHFCDWVVGYDRRDLLDAGDLRQLYTDALCSQIAGYGPRLAELGYHATNVYWGGGTPTRLTPSQLEKVHGAVCDAFDLSGVFEHTAECSPETLTDAHLDVLLGAGMNRISIGVQSFDDDVLRRMGRAHDAAGALGAVERLRRFGIENFNIDLITGFPDQTEESVLESVRRAIKLEVPHLSLYMFREVAEALVAVRQTAAGMRGQVSRKRRAEIYGAAKGLLESSGYEEYMVGYYALDPRFRFDGESYYFEMKGDFVGFGAGASSTLGRCALRSGAPHRYGAANVRDYIADPDALYAAPVAFMPDELYLTVAFKAFAAPDGIRFDRWLDQYGFSFESFRNARPGIDAWFRERVADGARFDETSNGIRLTPETRVPTMIWRR